MIHFIPAWYHPTRPWYTTDEVWFRSGAEAAADDTVTRARIFRRGAEETGLVVLNYAPSLRRFLHAQQLIDVPYWSFFDAVQGLADDYTRPLDFLDLDWPEDAGFFYNPFLVTVMRGEEVYARVQLAREGTVQSIRYYGAGMPSVDHLYDDRGFLSSVLMHDEEGRPITQYYLSRDGDVIVSEDLAGGGIDVVQNPDGRFRQSSYPDWEALIAELLGAHLDRRAGAGDTVVLSLAEQHDELVTSVLRDQTLVLSRAVARPTVVADRVVARAGVVLADSDQAPGADWALPVLSIYPLEARPTFGASANESTVYLTVFADDLTMPDLDFVIATSATHLVGNEHTRLLICTFRSQDVDHLRAIRQVIAGYQHLDVAFLDDEQALLGADIGVTEGPEERIQLVFVDREADLIGTMARSRVLIDLGSPVHPRLAAEAVNAGVPQINRVPQELATDRINGYVIGDDGELGPALDYFLSGLEHWNQSLVQCRVLEDLFSAPEVLARWELLREGVTYAGPADRP